MGLQYKNNNVFINGKPVVVAGSDGKAISQEECWVMQGTQRIKKPFTNTAKAQDLANVCSAITLNGMPLAHQQSYCRITSGNEASEGGVKTGTKIGRMIFTSGQPGVMLEGEPAVCHGDSVLSNEGNCQPSTWVQAQSSPLPITLKTQSSPLETLAKPAALNIEILIAPNADTQKVNLSRILLAEHTQTEHQTYYPFMGIPAHQSTCLWHADFLRAGRYEVSEIVTLYSSDVIRIPYGQADTLPYEDKTACMKLLPVSFYRYNDIEFSIDNRQYPAAQSFIYLFKDGYLWREFTALNPCWLLETDFARHAGCDERRSEGDVRGGICLPIEDTAGPHTFQIAVSHCQWTWHMIYRMGGFEPGDPRIKLDKILTTPRDETLISKRLQALNVHALIAGATLVDIPYESTQKHRIEIMRDKQGHDKSSPRYIAHCFNHMQVAGQYAAPAHMVWHQASIETGAIALYPDPYAQLNHMITLANDDIRKYHDTTEAQAHLHRIMEEYATLMIAQLEYCETLGIWHDYDEEDHNAIRNRAKSTQKDQFLSRVRLVLNRSQQGRNYLLNFWITNC